MTSTSTHARTPASRECDDQNMEATDACTSECLNAVCGDNYIYEGVE